MVWYSYLFQNFPICCDPHSQGFGIVNKAKVGGFLEFSCFFNDPVDIGNLISGSSAFYIQFEHLKVHGSCTVEARLGEFLVLRC